MGLTRKMLFTGISGLFKRDYLAVAFPGEQVYSVEEELKKAEHKGDIWERKDFASRVSGIKDSWRKAGGEHSLVEFHAVWWQPWGFLYDHFSALKEIKKGKFDCLVVLINDITEARWNLQIKTETGDRNAAKIGFRDLITWRANEIRISELLAQTLWPDDFEKRFYIIATGHPHGTLKELRETSKRKAYVAFPVRTLQAYRSHPATVSLWEKLAEEIKSFIQMVRADFTVFDPYTMYEKELQGLLVVDDPGRVAEVFDEHAIRDVLPRNLLNEPFLPKKRQGKPGHFTVSTLEIASALRDINAQVYERDRMMVRQSDFAVAFHPEESRGAMQELSWSVEYHGRAYALVGDQVMWNAWKDIFTDYLSSVDVSGNIEELKAKLQKVKTRGV